MAGIDALRVFSGNANPMLAKEICDYLQIPMGEIEVSSFADGEACVHINENVRGSDVFIIQPTCPPVNQNVMELLIMIDAFSRSSARRITAVIPYYGYGRQDRKAQPRVPITSKLVANLITTAGTDRLLTMDLHAGQIQGFFDIPVDNLFATPIIVDYFKEKNMKDLVLVSPDPGGVERTRAVARKIGVSMAIIDKRRETKNVAQVMNVIGDVEGKNLLILDDIIDTAGTLVEAVNALKRNGALDIYACATHPVLSGPAIDRINDAPLKEVVVTNTIPLGEKALKTEKITVLSVAKLLGEAIKRINQETSVSSLFI
ncbi:MAG: ribose-phosphate pyrophosphokinase [Nitrospirota bacterium]